MNKYKKIATAVVSTVMAGTMVFSLAACSKKNPRPPMVVFDINWDTESTNIAEGYKPNTKTVGEGENARKQLTYTMDKSITLNMNVGNQNSTKPQSIAFRGGDVELSGSVTLPDGQNYNTGSLKPAWAALGEQLKVNFNDAFTNLGSAKQITDNINTLANYDVLTASMEEINKNADYFLDLNDYVYYMPNYKAFLESNPVTVFSLTGTSTGGMYAAPYFDGNDDIEKYELAKHEWVDIILGTGSVDAATTTFKAQAESKNKQTTDGTKSSATAYMGTTGSWEVETTNPGDITKTVTVKLNYEAALTAAKDENSDLGKAVKDAAGKVYDGASGNIVDLQNFAINAKNGEVTGAQLTNILRAYVKVAYEEGKNKFYDGAKYGDVTTKPADVFNAAWGAWDVDLLVATMRCVVTDIQLFDADTVAQGTSKLFGLTGRQDTTQRTVDLYALGGELYGIRGMESRYEYTYLDKDGKIHDNRSNADSYDLLAKMGAMSNEGLLHVCGTQAAASAKTSFANSSSVQAFMLHDYVQTQTKPAIDGTKLPEGYNFAPVVTPVSKWDTDSDGTRETTMRFTESWRSVKNTGFCIPKAAVVNNAEKLSAVLAFVDYLFSPDGQILMTYGAQSTNGNTNPNGWWYATESSKALADVATEYAPATDYAPAQYAMKSATDADLATKKTCFVYQGKVWEGMAYADRNIPVMTDANKSFYLGEEVNGYKQGSGDVKASAKGDYTGYARKIVGTTLPIGNKDQGFEYQATAQCGLDGAANVATAINNETIKHTVLQLVEGQSLWYLTVPTALPLTGAQRDTLKNDAQTLISGTYFYNNSGTDQIYNVYTDLVFFGFNTGRDICNVASAGKMRASGAAYVEWLNTAGLTARVAITQSAWTDLDTLYKISSTTK